MELTEIQKSFIDDKLTKLSTSKFRSKFKLGKREKNYIEEKGILIIEKHAFDLIGNRLGPKNIENDGKQTPMRGHPVFIAQHATATCCRGCLYKWHHIDKNKELSNKEIKFIVALIMEWIVRNRYQ